MKTIFLNYAATSAIKPQRVIDAIAGFYASPNFEAVHRGSGASPEGEDMLAECRMLLARLFNIQHPERIAFCQNATHAINLALFGILKQGDHVLTTIYEHNSVLRPLNALKKRGVEFDIVTPSDGNKIDPTTLEGSIKSNTKMIIVNHSSNVTGAIQPVAEIGRIAKKRGLIFMVDAAQSAGLIDIDVERDNISLLAFTGHKSLYGPVGIGGLYFAPDVDPEPLIFGGTGTFSESFEQPAVLPDKFEAGTPNLIGVAGLIEGLKFVLDTGPEKINEHSSMLKDFFINEIMNLPDVRLIGYCKTAQTTPVISIVLERSRCYEVGEILEKSFGIIVRPGLHCAPLIHKHLGTLETGTIRFSFGFFNTREEVIEAIEALKTINKKLNGRAHP
jgi:cysteine desulfurase/selenocysteine lyase